ncbi:MAG TPA: signal peptide peptidase SppA [Candidatus Binatus sp.]|uniref:signal peptide peptidase SppA n=1 Tax=Candidatus Binatus sp. TaxID=2811406 RepID=UPI002B4A5307|nr:signal peptide peptidase SppA [Candidatus Binatus sp.]HKN14717.1 signal peptide peptidase SppA [Candidatus Binatus sp.]
MFRRFIRWVFRTAIIVVVLFAIVAISEYISHRVQPNSVLSVELDGTVGERGATGVLGLLSKSQTSLNVLRNAIDQGARDPKIVGMEIKVINPEMELAQAQEIVALIQSFKSHGKWTAAYIETAGESGLGNLPYLVASAADEVSLMPRGDLNLMGVQLRELFMRGTLDWMGITPNFASAGQYKSAANMFTNKDFTPAQKEEDEGLAGSLFDQIVAGIGAERKLSPDAIKALIDQAPLNADEGLKAKLVDRLEYEDEFTERVKNHGGTVHKEIDYTSYARASLFSNLGGNQIAVIYGDGEIQRGGEGFDPFSGPETTAVTSDDMSEALKSARENDDVRAVILRVNSPGGSMLASELIDREVELTAKKKPVVVSMSGYAASGGYLISIPAAKIIAEPGTITGSIGVLGGKFNITPAAQKLYANTDAVSRGANVGMFDMWTDFTPAQSKQFQDDIMRNYQYFLKLVAAGRHITVEQADAVAQGRVWTGEQAIKLKLVDSLGGLDEAMAAAKGLARLAPDQPVGIIELPEQPGLLQSLASGKMVGSIAQRPAARLVEPVIELIRAALSGHAIFSAAYCPVVPML